MKRRKGQLTNGNNLVKELQRQSHERKLLSLLCAEDLRKRIGGNPNNLVNN